MEYIATNLTASISELKANPMGVIAAAKGEPLAILNRNKPAFYCLPAELYERIMDYFEDLELVEIVKARAGQKEIPVELSDL